MSLTDSETESESLSPDWGMIDDLSQSHLCHESQSVDDYDMSQKGSDVSSSLQKKTKKLFIFSNNLNLRVYMK